MLQRYLLVWLVLSSYVAWQWPAFVGDGAFDPFAASKPGLKWLIAATMLAIGSLLPRDEIANVIRRWPTVLGGTAVQYLSMPLLAFAAVWLFGLDADARIGVIMVGCVPGAMASNVLTLAARGNVSYSVSLTTSATLLSPLVVPLTLGLLLGTGDAFGPVKDSAVFLATWVVVPVVAGHLVARSVEPVYRCALWGGPIVANLAILWIIAAVVGINRDQLGVVTPTVIAALLFVNLLGYAAGYVGGAALKLPETMRRALTLEVGMQNAGLGTTMALALFDNAAAAIPTAAYTFGCMLTGTVLASLWSRRETATDP